MYYTSTYSSPLGRLTLASGDGERLAGLWLAGQKYFGAGMPEEALEKDEMPIFAQAKKWLDRYFTGQKPGVAELPLAPAGGAFRQGVWRLLCEIPYGELRSYGEIAQKMAKQMGRKSMSSQAVGGAVGHNPISIIIPCHRVVGKTGNLTGYAGGIEAKIQLLRLEGADLSGLHPPKTGTAL